MSFLIFGIFGVSVMKGKFFRCTDSNDIVLPLDKEPCLSHKGLVWANPTYNFDDISVRPPH